MDTVVVVWLALAFVLASVALFINGATDTASAAAPIIATGVLRPRLALLLLALCNFAGTFLGGKVALTIQQGIVGQEYITLPVLCSVMVSVVAWGGIAWHMGWPVSKSHALVAGLAGGGFAKGGMDAYYAVWNGWWNGWTKVLAGLIASPVLGFFGAMLLCYVIIALCARLNPHKSRKVFDWLQVISCSLQATSHGSNDGGKFYGIYRQMFVSAGVAVVGVTTGGEAATWLLLWCAAVIAAGTFFGGKRIIKKIATGLGENLASWQGCAAETASSGVIFLASSLGVPVSTTHVVVSGVAGSHASLGFGNVRWDTALEIVQGWVVTFPTCWVVAFLAATLTLAIF